MARDKVKDDSEIVGACINGNTAAWEELVKKYSALISLSIEIRLNKYGLRAEAEDIEDIRQVVLSDLWQNKRLNTIERRGNISYWLSIVSGNAAIEYMRRKHKREGALTVPLCTMEETEYGVEARNIDASDHELSDRINSAMRSLPAREAMVVKLSLFYGKRYREIADIMSIPVGTVSSCLKRAREKLKKRLEDLHE